MFLFLEKYPPPLPPSSPPPPPSKAFSQQVWGCRDDSEIFRYKNHCKTQMAFLRKISGEFCEFPEMRKQYINFYDDSLHFDVETKQKSVHRHKTQSSLREFLQKNLALARKTPTAFRGNLIEPFVKGRYCRKKPYFFPLFAIYFSFFKNII